MMNIRVAPHKRMKLAVQSITWNIPRGDAFDPWLDEVVEAGFEGVALFAFQLADFLDNPDRLRRALSDRRLHLAAITGFVNDTPEWAETVMRFMNLFGARHLACTDFNTGLTIPGAAEILNERGRASRQYEVNVYYHNHTGGVAETMTQMEELMTLLDPDLVHTMLDIGHATKDFVELPPKDRALTFLKRHWHRVEYLELKDWNEVTDLNTPVGEGFADYDGIFSLITESGYRGDWLTVEQNGNAGPSLGRTPLECAHVSRTYLTRYGL